MENSRREAINLLSIPISDTIDRGELFGGLDRNLKLIEDSLKVDIIQRDNELILKGVQTDRARRIIREMMDVLEKGEKLDEQKINYIADLSDKGISYNSENVSGDIICFTHEGKPLRPKTIGQKGYVDTIRRKDIVFGIGPAGTGKTYIAVAMAVNAFKNKEIQKIILARPAVEAGERLGFLPGDLQEKVDPYLRPLYDAQNTTPEQMKMFLTRMGFGSKVVVTGDVTQIDLPRGKKSGLIEASKILKDVKEIGFCYMKDADVVRHQLVKKIINAYDVYYRAHPPKEEE